MGVLLHSLPELTDITMKFLLILSLAFIIFSNVSANKKVLKEILKLVKENNKLLSGAGYGGSEFVGAGSQNLPNWSEKTITWITKKHLDDKSNTVQKAREYSIERNKYFYKADPSQITPVNTVFQAKFDIKDFAKHQTNVNLDHFPATTQVISFPNMKTFVLNTIE